GNLILEDHVITKRVPGQPRDLAMILVSVVATVRKHDIGLHFAFQLFEAVFDLGPMIGEVAIPELVEKEPYVLGATQEGVSRVCRLSGAGPTCAEYDPMHLEGNASLDPIENGAAGTDLDVVGVCSEAQ